MCHDSRPTSIVEDIRRRCDGRTKLGEEVSRDVPGTVRAHPLVVGPVRVVEGFGCHIASYWFHALGALVYWKKFGRHLSFEEGEGFLYTLRSHQDTFITMSKFYASHAILKSPKHPWIAGKAPEWYV